jgi:hypothetical protein
MITLGATMFYAGVVMTAGSAGTLSFAGVPMMVFGADMVFSKYSISQ